MTSAVSLGAVADCDGVQFYAPDYLGETVEKRQYVFTEWDPTATSDMEALAVVFDCNGDGVLDASELEGFRIMVTFADGYRMDRSTEG